MEKAREFQKNIYFCFIDYAKAFDCVDHNKLLKILQEMGIPDHLTCLLRNLYAAQEATVRTGHGTTHWFQIGKGVRQGCILWISPFWRRSALGFLWKEWCYSWKSSPLATSCEELTHWKRLWCWEGLGAGGEGDDRGWDGWMASLTQWTRVWVNSGSWWWTVRPGVLRFMGSQRVRHDWATDWTEV